MLLLIKMDKQSVSSQSAGMNMVSSSRRNTVLSERDFQRQVFSRRVGHLTSDQSKKKFVSNLINSYKSGSYFKPMTEDQKMPSDYAPWFLKRTSQEMNEKRVELKKEYVKSQMRKMRNKQNRVRKNFVNGLDGRMNGKYNKIVAYEKEKQYMKNQESLMEHVLKSMKSDLASVEKKLEWLTKGFYADPEQMNKYIQHLKLSNQQEYERVQRLMAKRGELDDRISEMEGSITEGTAGENKIVKGTLVRFMESNAFLSEEHDAKIAELKMEMDEDNEMVSSISLEKDRQERAEYKKQLLDEYVEPTDDMLRWKFNYDVKLPSLGLSYLNNNYKLNMSAENDNNIIKRETEKIARV